MKLSTRTRYGVRALLDLAVHYGSGPLSLKDIAKNQDISVKYLEQLIAILRSAGFVKSLRGSKGGYILARSPEKIKLSDCFNSLEGAVATVECVEDNNYCARSADCVVKQVWKQVNDAIECVLQSITLKDLVDRTKTDNTINFQI